MAEITLVPLTEENREQFILDNQAAFNYGALEEFGLRDDHFEEDGEIISRTTIEQAIDSGEAYEIMQDGRAVGGVVIQVDGAHGELELLFVSPEAHSKGIGYAAWCAVEGLHPEVTTWETVTPYFEKRNIHFYVNCCGFHIVEFFHRRHPDPNDPDSTAQKDEQFSDGMFRFEKRRPAMTREELTEARRQIVSTVAKLEKALATLQSKEPADHYKSQITLARRRIAAFDLALKLIDEKLEEDAP